MDPKRALEFLENYTRSDGLSVSELMDSQVHGGLTYNDFLLLPGKIDFSASDVITDTRITRNVSLRTPFLSSPMDTVTEDNMAIAMAVSKPFCSFLLDLSEILYLQRLVFMSLKAFLTNSAAARWNRCHSP